MRKIAVVNFKGGTGKTTTVISLGAGLAMRGQRVLLVDVDTQGGVALALGLSHAHSITDVLTGQVPVQQALVHARQNLDVLPSDNTLLSAQRHIARYVNWQSILRDLLQPLEAAYDFLLIDCAASLTLLNINALSYASELFVPTQIEYLSLIGLNQVLENVARVRFPNRPRREVADLGISLIIPTMYDVRKKQSRRLLAELRSTYGQHVAHPIRTNVRLSEAPAFQKTIFEYDPSSSGAFDYNRLIDLVLQETLLTEEVPIGLQRPFQLTREEAAVAGDAALSGEAAAAEEAAAAGKAAGAEETAPVEETAAVKVLIAPETALPSPPPPEAPPPTPAKPTPATVPQCPYCGIPLESLMVAGYRVYQCEHCGYQKQVLLRDLHAR